MKYQTCILRYGKVLPYVLAYVLMVFTYPLNRLCNCKALNLFKPVEKRGKRDALCEINTAPKCFVYVSLKNSVITSKSQMRIIFRMILMKEAKLKEV